MPIETERTKKVNVREGNTKRNKDINRIPITHPKARPIHPAHNIFPLWEIVWL
jgi:hypothetical protein